MRNPVTGREAHVPEGGRVHGTWPNLIVIGAMKCGTTALHDHLDRHPHVAMSRPKELNFFFGRSAAANEHLDGWSPHGNRWRGPDWYRAHFDPSAPVRGESSPGYTSPDHPEVPEEIARVVSDARLVYLVRDPIERAASQWHHHRRDGDERRPLEAALLDPDSHYLQRSRYFERLLPYLGHFPVERIHVAVMEELVADPHATLRQLFRFLDVDPDAWPGPASSPVARAEGEQLTARTSNRLVAALQPDVERLRTFLGRALPWSL
jgi:hypothetical protein